jgi:hypothetical protein
MFPLLKVLFSLAMSKRGRRALRALFRYLASDDGRRLLAQARKVATGPEAQQVARHAARLLRLAAERTRVARASRRVPPRSRVSSFAAGGRRAGVAAAGRAWQRARSARAQRSRF